VEQAKNLKKSFFECPGIIEEMVVLYYSLGAFLPSLPRVYISFLPPSQQ
jgi:hypothetical protein